MDAVSAARFGGVGKGVGVEVGLHRIAPAAPIGRAAAPTRVCSPNASAGAWKPTLSMPSEATARAMRIAVSPDWR